MEIRLGGHSAGMNNRSLNKGFKIFSISGLKLWAIVMIIIPALLLLIASFLSYDYNNPIIWRFSVESYRTLLNPIYLKIFWRSFYIAFSSTIICVILGYPAAYYLASLKTKLKPLLLIMLLVPFWTNSLVRTYAIITLLKTHGYLNDLLLYLGIIHHPLQLLYSNLAVIIGLCYNLLPYMILPIYAVLEKMDKRLLQAAQDLGASRARAFRSITLPLSIPGIISGCLLVFLPAMTLFYIPVLLGGSGSYLLGNLIESQFLAIQNWPAGAATSLLLTMMMLILVAVVLSSSNKALKGAA